MTQPTPNGVVDPSAVIALLLYNGAKTLPETLDSLRLQERRDFVVLLVDDGSTDETQTICQTLAEKDPRFIYLKDGVRRGYIINARFALAEAQQRYPKAPYFTWGSDHDLYHPRWLGQVITALDEAPDASLAWSHCLRIDGEGLILPRVIHQFETRGIPSGRKRMMATLKANLTGKTQVGNMIYGLFRRQAFGDGPGMPAALLPDRLLLMEMALAGETVQVPEPLWYRRFEGLGSHSRQRRAAFASDPPLTLWLPVWLQHVIHFIRQGKVGVALDYGVGTVRWSMAHWVNLALPRLLRRLREKTTKPLGLWTHRVRKRVRGGLARIKKKLGG